jgi:hypothetical protein
MWGGKRSAQRPISEELAELARWAARRDARVRAVTKQVAAIHAESREKVRSLESLRRRSEQELGPSAARDKLIADIEAMKLVLISASGEASL